MTKWTSIDMLWQRPEPKPGVYAIYLDGVLTYIGQSVNVRSRLSAHGLRDSLDTPLLKTSWGECRWISVKVKYSVRLGDWLMIEHRLITRLRPPGNCVGSIRPATRIDRNYR